MGAGQEIHNGRCTCGAIKYRLTSKPIFVHCCHCRWCQRESGSAFALNAMIEADRVELLEGTPEAVLVPTASGGGQKVFRCPSCRVSVWSNYLRAGELVRFVRVGTLEEPDRLPPDIHIHTVSKQPWIALPDGVPVMVNFYDREEYWPEAALARVKALAG
jgi:hypothetical protein